MKLPKDGMNLVYELSQIEEDLIDQALKVTKGNRTYAAELLGIQRSTLVMKMRKLDIMQNDYGQNEDLE